MKVKDLIKQLQLLDEDKTIMITVNDGNPEDEDCDRAFNHLEIWDNGYETIEVFICEPSKYYMSKK